VVRDEFSNKEFQKCLVTNISRIIFPNPPSRNSVYVEHTFLFRKEDKKLDDPIYGYKSKTILGVHIGVYQP
jgi:hypothetical protein